MVTTELPGVDAPAAEDARLVRLYRAAAEIRDAIARAGDLRTMLGVACTTAVEVGGYRLAYAGLIDESSPNRDFVVLESAGDDVGWVNGVIASMNPDVPSGQTLGGRALRAGTTTVVTDLAGISPSSHRRGAVDEHGLRSLAMLPLRVRDRLIGGMAVYSTQPDAFGTAEVALLERTLSEIGFELERLERDDALRRSEERYRALVQEASDAMLVTGREGRFVDANEAAVRLTGYGFEELWRMGPGDLAPTDAMAGADLARMAQGEVVFAERPIVRKDGRLIWVELTGSLIRDGRFQAMLRDITVRREAEARAERLLRLYAATADIDRAIRAIDEPDALFDVACRVAVEVGEFRLAWIGLVDETAPGSPIRVAASAGAASAFMAATPSRAYLDPLPGVRRLPGIDAILEDRPVLVSFAQSEDPDAAAGAGLRSAVCVPIHSGARAVGVLAVYAAEDDAFGRPEIGLVERIAEDVSFRYEAIERERARRVLESERDRLAIAIEQSSEAIFIAEAADGRITYVNPVFEAMSETPRAGVIGTLARDWLGKAENPDTILAELRTFLAEGRSWTGEIDRRLPDGRRTRALVTMSPLRDADGTVTHLVCALRDVTAQHDLEEQLRQAQKMEAVGRLAGGVAHDFNNLLTAILGYASLALLELGDSPVAEDVSEIERTAERAAELTRQLLAFARQSPMVRTVFAPDDLVNGLAPMLRRIIGEDIELEIARPGAAGHVFGDKGGFEQAITNLVVNARDAMPEGGRITIRTADVEVDAAEASLHRDALPGPHLAITVADTGSGIPPELLDQVFQPFFTTKEVGRGTGLGLSTALGTVQSAGGWIEVDSAVGAGTTFRLVVPATTESLTAVGAGAEDGRPGSGNGRTVLLVEDDDGVRAFAVRVLQHAGYGIIEARNGNEALELAAAHEGAIDIVLTDVVMPGPTGPATVERLRALRPGLPALYVTGYASRSIPADRADATAVLPKPYTPTALLAKLEALLRQASGPA